MPLTISDAHQRTIVDWAYEWIGRVHGQSDGVQRPRDYVYRGIVVKIDGAPDQQSVTGLWVSFGVPHDPSQKSEMDEALKGRETKDLTVNGIKATCYKFEGSELVKVYHWGSKYATRAWQRLFGMPTLVGSVRKQSTPHRAVKTVEDNLALTAVPRQAVVEDARDEEVPGIELPASEA
jgi:hypothetical protein